MNLTINQYLFLKNIYRKYKIENNNQLSRSIENSFNKSNNKLSSIYDFVSHYYTYKYIKNSNDKIPLEFKLAMIKSIETLILLNKVN